MSLWTLTSIHTGKVRYSPCAGGPGRYAAFEYVMAPNPVSAGVEVIKGQEGDEALDRWFPSVKAGIESGCERRANSGEPIVGVRIDITKVSAHPIDTDAKAMECAGRRLLNAIESNLEKTGC